MKTIYYFEDDTRVYTGTLEMFNFLIETEAPNIKVVHFPNVESFNAQTIVSIKDLAAENVVLLLDFDLGRHTSQVILDAVNDCGGTKVPKILNSDSLTNEREALNRGYTKSVGKMLQADVLFKVCIEEFEKMDNELGPETNEGGLN